MRLNDLDPPRQRPSDACFEGSPHRARALNLPSPGRTIEFWVSIQPGAWGSDESKAASRVSIRALTAEIEHGKVPNPPCSDRAMHASKARLHRARALNLPSRVRTIEFLFSIQPRRGWSRESKAAFRLSIGALAAEIAYFQETLRKNDRVQHGPEND